VIQQVRAGRHAGRVMATSVAVRDVKSAIRTEVGAVAHRRVARHTPRCGAVNQAVRGAPSLWLDLDLRLAAETIDIGYLYIVKYSI
jgi:hypothetical protein